MSKEIPSNTVKVITMLKLDNGVVIDSEELTPEQKEAYIEFAIHLAAPKIAKYIAEGGLVKAPGEVCSEQLVNEAFFNYPPMMTVKQAAKFLNVGESTVREMERRWNGKFFPAVRMGSSIRIPRDELIQWVKDGGINKYKEEIAKADAEYEEQKRRNRGQSPSRDRSIIKKTR
ncbi:helix-turn-helix domain-containing protein [Clostridium scatologenes]|uniref:Excisionase family DNA binding domain-containing protein n=1 Tax=Clostridium scatologenes TaxID=1548 RepID=A0A0E3K5L9_CLOSL|nr:helix-turn-helix domain-containing protein [Clostridium scatologenes]AKA72362.1 excisionase family DNA binding domain-containing protein [Clostridium scatologenes]